MDKQTIRSLLNTHLKSLNVYTINKQNKLLDYKPIVDYIANHGITDKLLPEVIDVAVKTFIEAAFIQLLQDKTQRDAVAIANGIVVNGPEEMYKSLPKNPIYPSGINQLLRSVNGLDKHIVSALPEVTNKLTITDVDKVIDYLVYQYGMNPQLDRQVLIALKSKNGTDINTLAMILSSKRMTDTLFYLLAYVNKKNPLLAYKEPDAIYRYYYMAGISDEINKLLNTNISLNEIDIQHLYESQLAVNLSNLITYFQMYTIVSNEISNYVSVMKLDQLHYNDLLIITLYIILNKETEYKYLYEQIFE